MFEELVAGRWLRRGYSRSCEYAADTNLAKWRQEIVSLSGLPEPFSQPVIMFFVYGQWGRHITGLVRGMAQDSEEYYQILDDNFRPYYSKLPNYDPYSSECKPLEFLSTDWQDDKFAGFGSFANQPIGSGDCAQHFEALQEGLGEDRGIWFAGEHIAARRTWYSYRGLLERRGSCEKSPPPLRDYDRRITRISEDIHSCQIHG